MQLRFFGSVRVFDLTTIEVVGRLFRYLLFSFLFGLCKIKLFLRWSTTDYLVSDSS